MHPDFRAETLNAKPGTGGFLGVAQRYLENFLQRSQIVLDRRAKIARREVRYAKLKIKLG